MEAIRILRKVDRGGRAVGCGPLFMEKPHEKDSPAATDPPDQAYRSASEHEDSPATRKDQVGASSLAIRL